MKKTKWLLVIIIQTKENDYGWCIWYIKKVKMILILILIWWWWKIKMIYDGRRQKGIGCKYKGNEAQKCESRKERTEDWARKVLVGCTRVQSILGYWQNWMNASPLSHTHSSTFPSNTLQKKNFNRQTNKNTHTYIYKSNSPRHAPLCPALSLFFSFQFVKT